MTDARFSLVAVAAAGYIMVMRHTFHIVLALVVVGLGAGLATGQGWFAEASGQQAAGSGQTVELRHPDARAAVIRHGRAAEEARQTYLRTLIRLEQQLIQDLDKATAAVTRAGNLDEAMAIRTAREQAEQRLKEREGELKGQNVFEVSATQSWQPVMQVSRGQRLAITASGQWVAKTSDPRNFTVGPDGLRNERGQQRCHLEGRIGNGEPFVVGSRLNFVAPADGVLELRMNDSDHTDNDGSITVTVRRAG